MRSGDFKVSYKEDIAVLQTRFVIICIAFFIIALIGAVLVMGFCCGPIYPTTMGLAQQRHADAAGTIVGLLTAAASLGIIFIPWFQGWLLARGGLLWGVGAIGMSALALSAVAVVVCSSSTT